MACALQAALRLSNERFAERLGIAPRTVTAWHQKPNLRPKSEMQELLDTAFEQASAQAKARFARLVADVTADDGAAADTYNAELRLATDPHGVHSGVWPAGKTIDHVAMGGSQGLPARAVWMASMASTPWLRAETR
jgi:hypothetical protein